MAEEAVNHTRIIGQEQVRTMLAASVQSDTAAHAYLLAGPKGIGKTAVGLEFARHLLCDESGDKACGSCLQCLTSRNLQHPDLHLIFPLPSAKAGTSTEKEMEASSDAAARLTSQLAADPYAPPEIPKSRQGGDNKIKIGHMRHYLRIAWRKPFQARRKVFIILQPHRMVEAAQNSFLKVLEEPPLDGFFILITDTERGLLPTVRSRCRSVRMSPLKTSEIAEALREDGVPAEAAEMAAILSGGSYPHARELTGSGLHELQGKVVDFLSASAVCNPLKIADAADGLLDTGDLPPSAGLELLEVFLRDCLVYQALDRTADTPHLAFIDQSERIERFLKAYPKANLVEAMRSVEEGTRLLSVGLAADNVMSALAIRLHDAFGPRVRHQTQKSS